MVPWRSAELSGRSFLFVKSRRGGHLLQVHRGEGRGGRTGTSGHVDRRQGHPPERQRNAAWWSVRLSHRQRHGPLGTSAGGRQDGQDRKSTRLNSSHANISYAVFCLKKQ